MVKTIDKECPVCGKTYQANPQRLKHGKQTTCSRECSYKLRGMNLQTKQTVNCARCGKEFETTPSRTDAGKGIYCSRECFAPPTFGTCAHCGKVFRYSPSSKQIYCSKQCADSSEEKSKQSRIFAIKQWKDPDKRQSTLDGIKRRSMSHAWRNAPHFQRGNKHPRYKGNKNERLVQVSRHEYKEWRKQVLIQSNHTCQQCGKRGCRLESHHVKPWAEYPELRYEVSNGVALCEDCHLAAHGNKRKPITKTCVHCGQEFRPNKKSQKFCNRDCFTDWWKSPKS